ncbi:MAG: methionyl-tRNA formyltransferase [Acidimicrobiales bacterium]
MPEPDDASAPLPSAPRHPRRLVYLGTPDMAVGPLEALHDAGFDIALVVTASDKRRDRGSATSATPVKLAALSRGIPVTHDVADVAGAGADLGVVVAYGRILRRPVLAALPMVNLHFSLLPRWRGAAPVERAILAGDERTGVCVMAVEEGLDTGGVYASSELAIRRSSTAAELRQQLTTVGSRLLVETLQAGLTTPEPQVGEPIYAAKLGPEDLHLDWTRPARELERVVRLGGAWTTFRGKRLKVHRARAWPDDPALATSDARTARVPGAIGGGRIVTGDGILELAEVQPEGKARTPFSAWANGARPAAEERLGDHEAPADSFGEAKGLVSNQVDARNDDLGDEEASGAVRT